MAIFNMNADFKTNSREGTISIGHTLFLGHCQWSLWGGWSECSVSCGYIGSGMQTRGRHRAVEAANGGRKCMGKKLEERVCLHEKMEEVIKGTIKVDKPIYYCPGEAFLDFTQM